MKKEMLINVLQPEECRIAIVEDGVLEELYVERTSHESYVGNIYKGRIVNIEPSIQAAFVDFGVGRNGFLHVSDVEPAYYRHLEQRRPEKDASTAGPDDSPAGSEVEDLFFPQSESSPAGTGVGQTVLEEDVEHPGPEEAMPPPGLDMDAEEIVEDDHPETFAEERLPE